MKAESQESVPSLVRANGASPALHDSEKAECLADNLEWQCSLLREHTNSLHFWEVEREI